MTSQDRGWQNGGMIRAGAARGFESLVRSNGGDPRRVLAAAHVPESVFSDPEGKISFKSYANLLETAAIEGNCDTFGASFGLVFDTRNLGAAGYLFRYAPTIGEALRRFGKNFAFVQGDTDIDLEVQDGLARVTYQVRDAELHQRKQDAEFSIAMLSQACVAATGNKASVRRVEFEHACGTDRVFYAHHFAGETWFRRPTNAFYLRAAELETRLPEHDPYLLDLISTTMADGIAASCEEQRLLRAAEAFIQERIRLDDTGNITAIGLASWLGVSLRTLHRRLEASGDNFRSLRNRVLAGEAKQMLLGCRQSITEIAFILGFSDASAFSRAFRAETAMSPNQFRAAANLSGKVSPQSRRIRIG